MGYVTRFALSAFYAPHEKPEEVIRAFVKANDGAGFCLLENGDTSEPGKWYDHEADLLALSREHPHIIFTLEGEGEESGDIWKKYFCAGKIQVEKASVQIAPFDPERLVAK